MTDLPIRPIAPAEVYVLPVQMEILTPLERVEARKQREEARERRKKRERKAQGPGEPAPQDRPRPVDYRA